MRILVCLHDAYGGRGGIAKFNRDLLEGLCADPRVSEVVCLPRTIVEAEGKLPAKLDWRRRTAGSKARYAAALIGLAATERRWFDLVICGHLRLLPLMRLLEARGSPPLGLILHGVDAWEPFGGAQTRRGLRRLAWHLAVSRFTDERFRAWTGLPAAQARIVPNAVDLAQFTPGPKDADLARRLGVAGRTVLMGLGRLAATERYKGFDEVIELLPELRRRRGDVVYLIGGDGDDRPRLEAKARALGLDDAVIFAGWVPEAEKVAFLRLADVFLLAGWGEGFGIVLIEAMACGAPAIGSRLDASAEAVGDGRLGLVVDPKDPADLLAGIEAALARPRGVPEGLETFSRAAFHARIARLILDPHLGAPSPEAGA